MERRDEGTSTTTWSQRTIEGNIPTTFNDELAGGIHHWVPDPEDALVKAKPRHYSSTA